jgi:hypothetical protein
MPERTPSGAIQTARSKDNQRYAAKTLPIVALISLIAAAARDIGSGGEAHGLTRLELRDEQ